MHPHFFSLFFPVTAIVTCALRYPSCASASHTECGLMLGFFLDRLLMLPATGWIFYESRLLITVHSNRCIFFCDAGWTPKVVEVPPYVFFWIITRWTKNYLKSTRKSTGFWQFFRLKINLKVPVCFWPDFDCIHASLTLQIDLRISVKGVKSTSMYTASPEMCQVYNFDCGAGSRCDKVES